MFEGRFECEVCNYSWSTFSQMKIVLMDCPICGSPNQWIKTNNDQEDERYCSGMQEGGEA